MRYRLRPSDLERAREVARQWEVSQAIAQLLLQRGIETTDQARDYLSPQLSGLTPPDAMVDREAAADRLAHAVRRGETIAIFGDYDVDGTTSAAILSGVLEQLGGRVVASVANRFEGGYGFSDAALERVLRGNPSLIVTCDCGSSDHPRIEAARAAGVDVIVVDHHLVPDEPLPANAFLNPHRPDCGFAYKGLCSAGLVFHLGAAVRTALGVKMDMRPWLDLVALGSIADVVPLDGDNRRLVRAGLLRLSSSEARPGVAALRSLAKIRSGTALGAGDVAFRLAPRLNAAGRLGDPTVTLELLRARSREQAQGLAARIEQINEERKQVERRVTAEAKAQVRECYGETPGGPVVAAAEGWHRGVVGISAARLVDEFGVPALVIAIDDGVGHGSGRTTGGFPLYDALSRCAANLTRFGGHQAAAGVTLAQDRLEAFRADMANVGADLMRGAAAGPPDPLVDLVMEPGGGRLPKAAELASLEPLGEANPEPRFLLRGARLERGRVVGEGHLKLDLELGGRALSAFGFEMGEQLPQPGTTVDVLGALRPDSWRGGEAVELRLEALESSS